VEHSIIYGNSVIENKIFENSMIGHFVDLRGEKSDLNIGDYGVQK
jgi:hypothetical protein